MKVGAPGAVGSPPASRPTRGGGGEGFSLASTGAVRGAGQVASVSAPGAVMGVDALLALQDIGGPLERKRRAVRRAGRILDVLDALRLGLLEGELRAGDLDLLRRAVRDRREGTDDPGLEAVLDDIELRAAVEVAKLERADHAT
ncbi:flagellar assembly protein FliX [Phenylobacterium sp.]|uniref:flagellar assembly regulator FliX n=1 Tax=Phenylobacterium sp. TaxID=1871053 RepID=UPI00286A2D7E|nr:flagellar assembly protein FliX [Phenylobacterium sp.]